MGFAAGLMSKNRKFWFFVFVSAVGGAIMTAGYALYEICIPGFGLAYALFNIPFNIGQWGASIIISAVLYPAAVRLHKLTGLD
jgi:energy-coupling factor transport system substrate-specific component